MSYLGARAAYDGAQSVKAVSRRLVGAHYYDKGAAHVHPCGRGHHATGLDRDPFMAPIMRYRMAMADLRKKLEFLHC
ncbi:MAG: hypothetical protein H0V35_13365 [Nitrospira sp.]|nr:hypothetical protein [Nitrospira sp.]